MRRLRKGTQTKRSQNGHIAFMQGLISEFYCLYLTGNYPPQPQETFMVSSSSSSSLSYVKRVKSSCIYLM